MVMIKFHGALSKTDDAGKRVYTYRGPVWINQDKVVGFYEHTILTDGNQIRVMETLPEIAAKLTVPYTEDDGTKEETE